MSGFDPRWLDLREPADYAARDPGLARRASERALRNARTGVPTILDLGCGTGSTLRALTPHLSSPVRWILFDNDARLLADARRRANGLDVETLEGELGQLAALPVERAALVTASALFDLVSQPWLASFVTRLVSARTPLYAALSFDGRIAWDRPFGADCAMVRAFNAHQTTDKGLGAALGQDAGRELAKLLTVEGWSVTTAVSDWYLENSSAALERAFVSGIASAVRDLAEMPPTVIEAWETARLASVGQGCRVGHLDLFAEPAT